MSVLIIDEFVVGFASSCSVIAMSKLLDIIVEWSMFENPVAITVSSISSFKSVFSPAPQIISA